MNRSFARIYCVNLARSTDRWQWITEQAACFRLDVERVDAVDGEQIAFDTLVTSGLVTPEYGHARTPGALGLIATSAALWQRIAGAPDGWYLILEDDVRLHPAMLSAEAWNAAWSAVPADAALVLLGSCSPWLNGPADDEATLLAYAEPVNAHCARVRRTIQGTHAYALTPAAARALVERYLPLSQPVDYMPPSLFPIYALRRVAAPWDLLTPPGFYQCASMWAGMAVVQLHGVASVRSFPSTIGYASQPADDAGARAEAIAVAALARYVHDPADWPALYEAGRACEQAGHHQHAYRFLEACRQAATRRPPISAHEHLVRDFLCPDSLSISAFYATDPGARENGFGALRDLLAAGLDSPRGRGALRAHAPRLRGNARCYGDNPLRDEMARWSPGAAVAARPVGERSLAIVCDAGQAGEEWDPDVVRTRGHGGSEEAVVYVAESLARLGCQVTVYGNPPADTLHGFPACNPRFVERARLAEHARDATQRFDAAVVWRFPWVVAEIVPLAARTMLWLHDACPPGTRLPVPAEQLDAVMFLSHAQYEMSGGPAFVPPARCFLTANGIVLDQFTRHDGITRDPYRCVYASNYFRGLEVLLRAWPRVKAHHPRASLDIYYGWQTWMQTPAGWETMLRDLLASVAPLDVREHGRIGQEQLARELSSAAFWTYPCTYPETFCITGLKAQMAGCVPVYVERAALAETIVDGFRCADPLAYADLLIEALAHAGDEELLAGMRARMRAWALRHSWDRIAETWLHRLGWRPSGPGDSTSGDVPRRRRASRADDR